MIVIGYFVIALIVFLVWLKFFWSDTSTSKKDLKSWIILLFGPLVWPIVLPLSFLQLSHKKSVVEEAKPDREG
jgi:polyferredoxin